MFHRQSDLTVREFVVKASRVAKEGKQNPSVSRRQKFMAG